MKLHQNEQAFKPIKIILETKAEAEAFFNLCDRDDLPELTPDQKELLGELSDARTHMKIIV